MNKKADVGLGIILIIILVMISGSWLIKVGVRECNSNNECSDNEYCGSDFACHTIPVIEKTPVVVQRNYVGPAWIIGLAIVIAAVLSNFGKIMDAIASRKRKEEEPEEKTYTNFPVYYKTQSLK